VHYLLKDETVMKQPNLVQYILFLIFLLPAVTLFAQTPTIPPGVPEPGLVIWGAVFNATNASQQIAITSATWSVTDGTKTAIYNGATTPPTRVVSIGGQSFYILEVPFDTRQFGTISLSDPATQGINSFELKSSSPPTYSLTPTINGVLATVRSIDGAPATGGSVPVAGFTATTRGKVIRVDLAITPTIESYADWATRFFGSSGSPNAAANADPDHDGMSNYQEYLAGTNPTNATSVLRILALSVSQTQTTVGWLSVSNGSYVVESASDPSGPWTSAGQPIAGSAADTTQASVSRASSDSKQFYRIRVSQ
jgi:hypothetical protein